MAEMSLKEDQNNDTEANAILKPADLLLLARTLGRLKLNGYNYIDQITKILAEKFEKMDSSEFTQQMCAEIFAIFSQLETNIALENLVNLLEKKLHNEIFNFDTIMILIDTCYKRLCDGKLMKQNVSHEKLANLIEMLKIQF